MIGLAGQSVHLIRSNETLVPPKMFPKTDITAQGQFTADGAQIANFRLCQDASGWVLARYARPIYDMYTTHDTCVGIWITNTF